MAQSIKKKWTKPEVRHFDTLEELVEFYGARASNADLEKFEEMADQAQNPRAKAWQQIQRRFANR